MKRLFWQAPQDYVQWLLPGAVFVSNLSAELENETLYADLLFEVILLGVRMLLHIEFQRNRDAQMPERLWEYNMKASKKYKCTVWSVVIYLKNDGQVPEPPLQRKLPDEHIVHHFDYGIIQLWDITPEKIKGMRRKGLIPLLPLTKNGANREVIEEALVLLTQSAGSATSELLTLTYGFASLILENEADQEWLDRRFSQMFDILRESPAFQKIMQVGWKEGMEEGRQEGIQEGIVQGHQETLKTLRQTLLKIVNARFPKILHLAKGQGAIIDDPDVLEDLIVKISTAQTLQEAQNYLIDWPEADAKDNDNEQV